MAKTARELLIEVESDLAHESHENLLVPLIASGRAPRSVLAAIACEQHRVIPSDWRSFLVLAARSPHPAAGVFFTALAQREVLALEALAGFTKACGVDEQMLESYAPEAGCQAYTAYLGWLALNGDPTNVVIACVANFTAWGTYCKTVSKGLRQHYGFDDAGCAFFDFFASLAPELEQPALGVVQAALDSGRSTKPAREYGRLLQTYELMFWNTLAT